MFDSIQIKSGFNGKDLKEDIKYVDELIQLGAYEDDYDTKFNVGDELNNLKPSSHYHENIELLEGITDNDIFKWNRKSSDAKIKTSDYINDKSYVDINKLNLKINNSIKNNDNLKAIYYEYEELVINSLTNEKVLITIDDNGGLNTKKLL